MSATATPPRLTYYGRAVLEVLCWDRQSDRLAAVVANRTGPGSVLVATELDCFHPTADGLTRDAAAAESARVVIDADGALARAA